MDHGIISNFDIGAIFVQVCLTYVLSVGYLCPVVSMQLRVTLVNVILSYQGLRLSNLTKGRYDETFAGEDGERWQHRLCNTGKNTYY